MLLDDNLVLFDSVPLASGESEAVALTSLYKPGKHHDPIPMVVRLLGDYAAVTAMEIKMQEGDTAEGPFSDVPGATLSLTQEDIAAGGNVAWRFVPSKTTKQWLKLSATVTGDAPDGQLFAAIVREEEMPYESGLYIDKGVIKG